MIAVSGGFGAVCPTPLATGARCTICRVLCAGVGAVRSGGAGVLLCPARARRTEVAGRTQLQVRRDGVVWAEVAGGACRAARLLGQVVVAARGAGDRAGRAGWAVVALGTGAAHYWVITWTGRKSELSNLPYNANINYKNICI